MSSTSPPFSSSASIEQTLRETFAQLESGFNQTAILRGEPTRAQTHLKQLTNKMADGKKLIKEYERRAKEEVEEEGNNNNNNNSIAAGLDQIQLTKKKMVSELNRFVTMKKAAQNAIAEKQAAIAETTRVSSSSAAQVSRLAGVMPTFQKMHEIKESDDLREMDSQQLVQHGRGMMNQTDKSVSRSKKIVHETIEMGAVTAAKLKEQTQKLDEITDELDELQFSVRKSLNLVRDITKGLATDRCVITLMLLVALGVVAIIIVKATGADKKKSSSPAPAPEGATARRLLLHSIEYSLM